jgi:hypothetical protein
MAFTTVHWRARVHLCKYERKVLTTYVLIIYLTLDKYQLCRFHTYIFCYKIWKLERADMSKGLISHAT